MTSTLIVVDSISQDSFIEEGFRSVPLCFTIFISPPPPRVSIGILPPHHESHVQVMTYCKEQYSDVLHALKVIRFVSDATPQSEVYLYMHRLESGKLPRSPSFPLVSGAFL